MRAFLRRASTSTLLGYLPYFLTMLVILRSRPFLRLPYDMWHHLMLIRGWYQDGEPILTMPGTTYHEVLWHRIWAILFKFINVSDVFVWAKIIHCSQFLWTIVCVFFFVDVFLKHGAEGCTPKNRRLCALLGAWCFVLGAGTFSAQYQLSWILWYGVNYQGLTLPTYFLAAGLLLESAFSKSTFRSLVFGLLSIFAFVTIIAFHPMEASYFLIFLCFFGLLLFPELKSLADKSWIMPLILISPFVLGPILFFTLPLIGIPLPRIYILGDSPDFTALWARALRLGNKIQAHTLHRGLSSFNELAIGGCVLLLGFVGFRIFHKRSLRALTGSRSRVLLLSVLTSSAFWLMPRLAVTSGVLALFSTDELVWRLSLAAPWFLGFSMWAALFIGRQVTFRGSVVALVPLAAIFLMSRFVLSGPFNTTAASVVRSLELVNRHHVGIQYDQKALKRLDELVLLTPTPPASNKRNIFLIRSDLQTYVRAATGAYVLGYRLGPVSENDYNRLRNKDQFHLVVIKPPADLPVDADMARAFPSMRLLNQL